MMKAMFYIIFYWEYHVNHKKKQQLYEETSQTICPLFMFMLLLFMCNGR
jgi:hypothetical protein